MQPAMINLCLLLALATTTMPNDAIKTKAQPTNGKIQAAESGVSELREWVEAYRSDEGALNRVYSVTYSDNRRKRMAELYKHWLDLLSQRPFEKSNYDT